MASFLQYVKANSHAILVTLVAVQNLHLVKGVPALILGVVISMASTLGGQ